MRIGSKGRPFYRVVAVDQRYRRSGAYIELLGTYNPISEPHEIKLKQDRIDDWIKKGAQLSDGFLRIIGKAPQKPPRKAKKAKEEPKQESQIGTNSSRIESQESSEKAVEVTPTEEPIANTETPVKEQIKSDTSEVSEPVGHTEETGSAEEQGSESASQLISEDKKEDSKEEPS